MPVSTSHGKARSESPRARDLPSTPDAAVTVPDRDAKSGRFVPGNRAARRRALKRMGRELAWLDPEHCEPWARPYVTAARQHAGDLLADLRVEGALASPLAEETASARLAYRALLALGLAGDKKALEQARAWLRESRQHALALEALARTTRSAGSGPSALHRRILDARPEPRDPEPDGAA